MSGELFSPAFDSPTRKGTTFSAVFNLVATICGGGVLSLPYALQSMGLGLGVFTLVLVALASDFTIYALIVCSRRTGAQTYEDIAKIAFGKSAQGVTLILVLVLTFLCVLGYTILARDLLGSLVEGWILTHRSLSWLERNLVSTIACGIIAPACFIKHLTELKYLSVISFGSIMVLAIALFVRTSQSTPRGKVVWINKNLGNCLSGLAVLICTYLCHFNVLSVHSELRQPTRKHAHRVVHVTVAVTSGLYLFLGMLGFMYGVYHDPVEGNILNSFSSDDQLVNAGKLGLAITVMLHLPMLVVPCRDTLARLYVYFKTGLSYQDSTPTDTDAPSHQSTSPSSITTPATPVSCVQIDAGYDHEACGELDPLNVTQLSEPLLQLHSIPKSANEKVCGGNGQQQRSSLATSLAQLSLIVWLTFMVLGLDIFLAFLITDVALVWDLLGSSVSIVIAYVLPCGAYIIIRRSKPSSDPQIRVSWCILVFSVFLGLLCTANVLYTLSSH